MLKMISGMFPLLFFLDYEHCCCYKELITIIDVADYTEFFSPFLVVRNLLHVVDELLIEQPVLLTLISEPVFSISGPSLPSFRQRWLWIEDG